MRASRILQRRRKRAGVHQPASGRRGNERWQVWARDRVTAWVERARRQGYKVGCGGVNTLARGDSAREYIDKNERCCASEGAR